MAQQNINANSSNEIPMPGGHGQTMFVVGRLADRDHVLVVSIPPHGITVFYCELHNQLFETNKTKCDQC